ncbi:MAG: TonB-dependent receptor [Paludibacteraceae bacterium]|nr:TonB-dependent receptor [Paludibacteraceae bacterium]
MKQLFLTPIITISCFFSAFSQVDTAMFRLDEVEVVATKAQQQHNAKAQSSCILEKDYFTAQRGNTLAQMLNQTPGLQSMDIGSGTSKPAIRGMGFNRISVVSQGIKQEGQQWGADHGLEIDAFDIDGIRIIKGPASLLYGGDAMGGVIEMLQPTIPTTNQVFGEMALFTKSANWNIGASFMIGQKINHLWWRLRYSENHYADLSVPIDTINYLTYKIPIDNHRLKNTAGMERDINAQLSYINGSYKSDYSVSYVFQKSGFFPGSHGVPDLTRLQHDGTIWNIELPYSQVGHLKGSTKQRFIIDNQTLNLTLGYQRNHRSEMAAFHTHYSNQPAPTHDADRELDFLLHTTSGTFEWHIHHSDTLKQTIGIDAQWQHNTIGGYSFLLPQYDRTTAGLFWLVDWDVTSKVCLSGGLRYDHGFFDIQSHYDNYLFEYLTSKGIDLPTAESYSWSSVDLRRNMGNISGSVGLVYTHDKSNTIKVNIGRCFRLPTANELASNGIHHGAFRHEQGNPQLGSEKGWQIDFSYQMSTKWVELLVTPFGSYYTNYIYLSPSGEWSLLPHSSQIYRYEQTKAVFAGSELQIMVHILRNNTACRRLDYNLSADYVFTYNINALTATPFSPPATIRQSIEWEIIDGLTLTPELELIAPQNRVAHNELRTKGVTLLNLTASYSFSCFDSKATLNFNYKNITNRVYFNHLSYYRTIGIPEPASNFQISLTLPFNIKTK